MSEKCVITIEDVLYQAKRKNRNIDTYKIKKAYSYAENKHKNQYRKSGEPYIIHPLHVAYTLAKLGLDTQTICAALLHDVVEDTDACYGDIEKNGIITVQKNKATIFNCVYREYMICHQSIFAKREVLCRYPFDIQYRLCADRDWLTKILKNNYTVEYVNKAICKYDITGQSSDPQKFMEESKKVSIKYGGEKAKIFIKVKRYFGKVKNLLLGWF